jgi:hypothetical protein
MEGREENLPSLTIVSTMRTAERMDWMTRRAIPNAWDWVGWRYTSKYVYKRGGWEIRRGTYAQFNFFSEWDGEDGEDDVAEFHDPVEGVVAFAVVWFCEDDYCKSTSC